MLGILFEEKQIEKIGLKKYLELLMADSVFSSFEIGFTEKCVDSIGLKVLQQTGIPMSFHIPYHLSNAPYDASLICSDPDGLKKATAEFIQFSQAISSTSTPIIVAHLSKDHNRDHNLRYIDFLLNLFEKSSYSATLALENLYDHQIKYLTSDLKQYIDYFKTDNLSVCLDIPNHYLSGEKDICVKPAHLHFHGFNKNQRHLGLDETTLKISNEYFKRYPDTVAIFELLDHPEYQDSLSHSISLIKNNTM